MGNLLNKISLLFKKDEKLPVVYALDAETFRCLKQYDRALKSIKKAIKKEPDNDMFYSSEALIYKEMKKYDLALKSIDRALSLKPHINILKRIKEDILQAKG